MPVATEIDPELIAACRRGDRESFRVLFELYQDKVYSIALRYAGDGAAAMDITQDVFVKLFSTLAGFRGESSFETWLYRLVVNRCLDSRRKLRRLLPFLDARVSEPARVNEPMTERLIRGERRQAVRAAIDKLSPDLRLAVVLRYTEELSYEEMAEVLGCSKGTVASRLNRAHEKLARRLKTI